MPSSHFACSTVVADETWATAFTLDCDGRTPGLVTAIQTNFMCAVHYFHSAKWSEILALWGSSSVSSASFRCSPRLSPTPENILMPSSHFFFLLRLSKLNEQRAYAEKPGGRVLSPNPRRLNSRVPPKRRRTLSLACLPPLSLAG